MRALVILASASASIWLAGCGSDFAPYNVLDRLRLLAVRAEPAELGPGETVNLDALVWTPDDRPVEHAWSWCPVAGSSTDGYACPLTEEEIQTVADEALGEGVVNIQLALGTEATAQLPYPGEPALLIGLCDRIAAETATASTGNLDCSGGLEILVRLQVTSGGEEVEAIKRLRILPGAKADKNENPVLGGNLRVADVQAQSATEGLVVAADGTTPAPANSSVQLFADVEADSAQAYLPSPTDIEPEPAPVSESLFLTWFVSNGKTEATRTSFLPNETSFEDLAMNTWSVGPPPRDAGKRADVILVLRDDRGGVTWLERQLVIEGETP